MKKALLRFLIIFSSFFVTILSNLLNKEAVLRKWGVLETENAIFYSLSGGLINFNNNIISNVQSIDIMVSVLFIAISVMMLSNFIYKKFSRKSVYDLIRRRNKVLWYIKNVCYLCCYSFLICFLYYSTVILLSIGIYGNIKFSEQFILSVFDMFLNSSLLCIFLSYISNIIAIIFDNDILGVIVSISILGICIFSLCAFFNANSSLIKLNILFYIIPSIKMFPNLYMEYNFSFLKFAILMSVINLLCILYGLFIIKKLNIYSVDKELDCG